jgi:hypothetical protein
MKWIDDRVELGVSRSAMNEKRLERLSKRGIWVYENGERKRVSNMTLDEVFEIIDFIKEEVYQRLKRKGADHITAFIWGLGREQFHVIYPHLKSKAIELKRVPTSEQGD